eukprot:FR741413.1.p1 GENE.FR741413.1~~FR741413.1.p1  ORF type:complete len:215 (+),score=27.33 FR741413.1:1-645(+)
MGPFENYAEMILQFGYATLFAAAFPLAPAIAFLANHLEIRADLYSLGCMSTRAIPDGAQDIGSWEPILNMMVTASIISNSALICLTGHWMAGDEIEYNWMVRVLTFLAMEHCLLVMKSVISIATPEVPDGVQIQLDRQEFITGKLIDGNDDDIELPDDDAGGGASSMDAAPTIFQHDTDNTTLLHIDEERKARDRHKKRLRKLGVESEVEMKGE